jgi:hypothetical protein
MPFVDEIPSRQLAVPDEEGEWFEVRLLSWKELDECRRERSRRYMAQMREMGGELIKAVADAESGGSAEAEAIDEARKENERLDAIESFDRELLVTKSVTGWSYERHFQNTLLGKLDEHTFTWLFEAIAALYVGDDAQRKVDSATSMTSSTEAVLAPTPST